MLVKEGRPVALTAGTPNMEEEIGGAHVTQAFSPVLRAVGSRCNPEAFSSIQSWYAIRSDGAKAGSLRWSVERQQKNPCLLPRPSPVLDSFAPAVLASLLLPGAISKRPRPPRSPGIRRPLSRGGPRGVTEAGATEFPIGLGLAECTDKQAVGDHVGAVTGLRKQHQGTPGVRRVLCLGWRKARAD